MALNNLTTATGLIPQMATHGGHLYLIPSPNQLGYLVQPRPYNIDPSHPELPPPDAIHQRFIQQQHNAIQEQQQQRLQHQQNNQLQTTPKPTTKRVQTQPPQSIDQTNAKIRNIKEKCISHYIDGQLIIETSKPLTDKKLKLSKKKKLNTAPKQQPHNQQQQQHQQQEIQQIQQQQQQQQQLLVLQRQHHHQQQQSQPNPPPGPPQQQKQSAQRSQSDDIKKLRAEMPNWTVAEVVNFIERHEDIKNYAHKFAEDEVDGKALMLMIDRNLNFQVLTSMFKHGPAMKIEATLSKYKLNE